MRKLRGPTQEDLGAALRAGQLVAIVDVVEGSEPYRVRITAEWWSPTLHLAILHGLTLVRAAARPQPKRRP